MIKSLSPYYIYFPLVSPSSGLTAISYTLKVYVYSGAKNSVLGTADYEITKQNASEREGTEKINIGRLVNDFIDFKAFQYSPTQLVDGNNQVWARTEVYYNTTQDGENLIPQSITTQLVLKGYGYGMSGENPQPPEDKVLLANRNYKVSRKGKFIFPILIDELPSPPPSLFLVSVEPNPSYPNYLVTFNLNVELTDFVLVIVSDENVHFLNMPSATSPLIQEIVWGEGTFSAFLQGYDPIANEIVTSNSLNITP